MMPLIEGTAVNQAFDRMGLMRLVRGMRRPRSSRRVYRIEFDIRLIEHLSGEFPRRFSTLT
jgi:hypothetical protein